MDLKSQNKFGLKQIRIYSKNLRKELHKWFSVLKMRIDKKPLVQMNVNYLKILTSESSVLSSDIGMNFKQKYID